MPKKKKSFQARLIKLLLFVAIHAAAAWAGVLAGRYVVQDTPNVNALENFRPSASTKVYAADGTLLDQFALERRTPIPVREMPKSLRDAVVAVEDSRFYSHKGVDVIGVGRAMLSNIKAGRIVSGASTLTQQLAKMLFLHPKQTYERKLKEALLAVQIEKNFTKDEILEFYLNQVNMGEGRYGAEAASQYYFGKPARELELEEAALLAGIPQRPSALSPKRNPRNAIGRRNHVLRRMADEGFITRDEADEAIKQPIVLAERPKERRPASAAAYFIEDVRRYVAKNYGDEALYRGGLEIYTTVDLPMQQAAERAIHQGLIARDRAKGFRKDDLLNVTDAGTLPEDYEDPSWIHNPVVGGHVTGVISFVSNRSARARVGSWNLIIDDETVAWTKRSPSSVFRVGDIARFEVKTLDAETKRLTGEFEQIPIEQAALFAIDVQTGDVKAMVGGFDFELSEFNRATQARRQTGSAFKPIYYATALEQGYTPGTLLLDVPTTFVFPVTRQTYSPKNYYPTFSGLVSFRTALEKSLNVVSVQMLNDIGYDVAIDHARAMGIESRLAPYPSLALGTADITLMEMVSAYTTFPNGGVHVKPSFLRRIYNRKGEIVEEQFGKPRRVMDQATAFQMVYLLMGVVENGTGKKAKKLGRPLGGKTGTTDDYSDAWFIGFSPSLAVGVWVGHEEKKSLGRKQTGATAALPIWMDFMEEALADTPPESFHQPRNITFVQVDRRTGKPRGPECPEDVVVTEAFTIHHAPEGTCNALDHYRLGLPMCLLKYELESTFQGTAFVVDDELELIATAESGRCDIHVNPATREILTYAGDGTTLYIPYRVRPGGGNQMVLPRETLKGSSAYIVPVNLKPGQARARR